MRGMIRVVLLAAVVAVVAVLACSREIQKEEAKAPGKTQTQEKAQVSLETDIVPVFLNSCAPCHKRKGGNKHAVEHGVYYENKQDILGKVGKFIIPGKPGKSGLLKVLDQTMPVGDHKIVMPPPKSNVPAWSKQDLEKFSQWVEQGAKDN